MYVTTKMLLHYMFLFCMRMCYSNWKLVIQQCIDLTDLAMHHWSCLSFVKCKRDQLMNLAV